MESALGEHPKPRVRAQRGEGNSVEGPGVLHEREGVAQTSPSSPCKPPRGACSSRRRGRGASALGATLRPREARSGRATGATERRPTHPQPRALAKWRRPAGDPGGDSGAAARGAPRASERPGAGAGLGVEASPAWRTRNRELQPRWGDPEGGGGLPGRGRECARTPPSAVSRPRPPNPQGEPELAPGLT